MPTGLYPKNLLVDGFILQAGQMDIRRGESTDQTADIMLDMQKAGRGETHSCLCGQLGISIYKTYDFT